MRLPEDKVFTRLRLLQYNIMMAKMSVFDGLGWVSSDESRVVVLQMLSCCLNHDLNDVRN
jgi:hypothetical protein